MSIIRKRKQKMILSWFLGVLTATGVMALLVAFSVLDIGAYINFTPIDTTEEIVYVPQIVASRFLEVGTVLTEDDLTEVLVPVDNEVVSVGSKEELIGKEILMDVHKMLPITKPMVDSNMLTTDNQRVFEFDFVRLPFNLEMGDFVDVRIIFPNGQDYVVLSKKEVIHFERAADNLHEGLLSLLVEEDEVLRMSSALVDKVLTETAELYLVKYLEPHKQEAAQISYPVNRSVLSVLGQNPNLTDLPDMSMLTNNRYLLDIALKELLDEDDEWFSIFTNDEESEGIEDSSITSNASGDSSSDSSSNSSSSTGTGNTPSSSTNSSPNANTSNTSSSNTSSGSSSDDAGSTMTGF